MALAGTFDAFSVLEVSQWLQTVGRPGCLIVELPAGDALVWFGEGGIVGAESSSGATQDPATVLFDVVRSGPVSWRFQSLVTPPSGASMPIDVATCAAAMEDLVAEWAELLTLVPSIKGVVRLVDQPAKEVVLNAARWDAVRRLAVSPVVVSAVFDHAD